MPFLAEAIQQLPEKQAKAVQVSCELFAGRGEFDFASATTRRKIPVDINWKNIKLCVFECPLKSGNFIDRLKYLHEKFVNMPDWIEIVKQTVHKTTQELNAELRQVCANDGEGLMLRRMDDAYQGGRTYDLRKFKPLEDAEVVVIGGHENGKQSVRMRDAEGREFHLTCEEPTTNGNSRYLLPTSSPAKRKTAFPNTQVSYGLEDPFENFVHKSRQTRKRTVKETNKKAP